MGSLPPTVNAVLLAPSAPAYHGKTGRADFALNLINNLYKIERDLKRDRNSERKTGPYEQSLSILAHLKSRIEKTQSQVTAQSALGKASSYQASK